jgi:metal-responsive CopG/Arc/MetJ family transcriptional regulator
MQETTTLTISLPEKLRKKIEVAAKAQDRSVSSFVRQIISKIIEAEKSK